MSCEGCCPENPVSWSPPATPSNRGLIFPSSCITKNPALFGLVNFNIGLFVNEDNNVVGTLMTSGGDTGFIAAYDSNGQVQIVESLSDQLTSLLSGPNSYTLVYNNPISANSVSYCINFGSNSNSPSGTVTAKICIPNSVSMPLPPSNGLTGFIHPSPDSQVICQLNYTITTQNKSCKGPTSVSETYTKYYPDLRIEKVLKGCGCTLAQKVDSINNPNDMNVTFDRMAEYASLRLILSSVLFGEFDIKYLRQRYYEEFLRRLQDSSYSGYYDRFTVGTFYRYWKYFKK